MITRFAYFPLLFVFSFSLASNAAIIDVTDSNGIIHQVDTEQSCVITDVQCEAYDTQVPPNCIHERKMLDCSVELPPLCDVWQETQACIDQANAAPNFATSIDGTGDLAASVAAAGSGGLSLFKSDLKRCYKSFLCDECGTGKPDKGISDAGKAASVVSTAGAGAAGAITLEVAVAGSLAGSVGTLAALATPAGYVVLGVMAVQYIAAANCKGKGMDTLVGAKLAKYIGKDCVVNIFGACAKYQKYYCTYGNKFSFVLAREIKKQLVVANGTPYWPTMPFLPPIDEGSLGTNLVDCTALDISALNDPALDFSTMDLTDLFGDIKEKLANATTDASNVSATIEGLVGANTQTFVTGVSPTNAAEIGSATASYTPIVADTSTANGWSTNPPATADMYTQVIGGGTAEFCALTHVQQVEQVKQQFYGCAANVTNDSTCSVKLATLRADAIANSQSVEWIDGAGVTHVGLPACNVAAGQTMDNTMCYDAAVYQSASLDSFAATQATYICTQGPHDPVTGATGGVI